MSGELDLLKKNYTQQYLQIAAITCHVIVYFHLFLLECVT